MTFVLPTEAASPTRRNTDYRNTAKSPSACPALTLLLHGSPVAPTTELRFCPRIRVRSLSYLPSDPLPASIVRPLGDHSLLPKAAVLPPRGGQSEPWKRPLFRRHERSLVSCFAWNKTPPPHHASPLLLLGIPSWGLQDLPPHSLISLLQEALSDHCHTSLLTLEVPSVQF